MMQVMRYILLAGLLIFVSSMLVICRADMMPETSGPCYMKSEWDLNSDKPHWVCLDKEPFKISCLDGYILTFKITDRGCKDDCIRWRQEYTDAELKCVKDSK